MMKILKPGKVEMRKFVCTNCNCEFVVGEYEEAVHWDGDNWVATCPVCRTRLLWNDGKTYEKPAQDVARHPLANSVTFRETT